MKEFIIFLLLLAILFGIACWGLSPTQSNCYNVTMVEVK